MDNKYCGQPTDYAPVVEDRSRVVFSYDLQPVEGKELVTWREVVFFKKQGAPTLEAVKRSIIEDINRHTDEKILKGFVWKNMNVWLSEENQRNFSEAQRLSILPAGIAAHSSLPCCRSRSTHRLSRRRGI